MQEVSSRLPPLPRPLPGLPRRGGTLSEGAEQCASQQLWPRHPSVRPSVCVRVSLHHQTSWCQCRRR